jgi:hypothetical protein
MRNSCATVLLPEPEPEPPTTKARSPVAKNSEMSSSTRAAGRPGYAKDTPASSSSLVHACGWTLRNERSHRHCALGDGDKLRDRHLHVACCYEARPEHGHDVAGGVAGADLVCAEPKTLDKHRVRCELGQALGDRPDGVASVGGGADAVKRELDLCELGRLRVECLDSRGRGDGTLHKRCGDSSISTLALRGRGGEDLEGDLYEHEGRDGREDGEGEGPRPLEGQSEACDKGRDVLNGEAGSEGGGRVVSFPGRSSQRVFVTVVTKSTCLTNVAISLDLEPLVPMWVPGPQARSGGMSLESRKCQNPLVEDVEADEKGQLPFGA